METCERSKTLLDSKRFEWGIGARLIRQSLASCEGLPATLHEVAADARLTSEAASKLLAEMVADGEVREHARRTGKRVQVLYAIKQSANLTNLTREKEAGSLMPAGASANPRIRVLTTDSGRQLRMQQQQQTKTIELSVGIIDPHGVAHKQVTFGRRPKGSDIFDVSTNPMARVPVQRDLLGLRVAITKFGDLNMSMPVDLMSLLNLYSEDARKLFNGYEEFLVETSIEREDQSNSDAEVDLIFGVEQDGVLYRRFVFGNDLRVTDEVAADTDNLSGLRRSCFLISRELVRVASEDGSRTLPCPLALEVFDRMDGEDINLLMNAAQRWRASFHARRGTLQAAAGA